MAKKFRYSHLWGRPFVHHPDGCVAVIARLRNEHIFGRWKIIAGKFKRVPVRRRRGPLAHSRPEAVRRFQRSGYIAYA